MSERSESLNMPKAATKTKSLRCPSPFCDVLRFRFSVHYWVSGLVAVATPRRAVYSLGRHEGHSGAQDAFSGWAQPRTTKDNGSELFGHRRSPLAFAGGAIHEVSRDFRHARMLTLALSRSHKTPGLDARGSQPKHPLMRLPVWRLLRMVPTKLAHELPTCIRFTSFVIFIMSLHDVPRRLFETEGPAIEVKTSLGRKMVVDFFLLRVLQS